MSLLRPIQRPRRACDSPLGHTERPRVSREVSSLTPEDIETSAVDWRHLDVPTVLRRRDRMEWHDLPPEQRAAYLEVAIAKWREMFGADAEPAIEVARRCWR